jgi:hypothetical protein
MVCLAMEMDFLGPEPALVLTLLRVKTMIATAAHKKHNQYWKNLLTCQHSKLFLEEHLGVASKKIFNMNKRRLLILVGTVTGHFSCNYHLHKFGLRLRQMPVGSEDHVPSGMFVPFTSQKTFANPRKTCPEFFPAPASD